MRAIKALAEKQRTPSTKQAPQCPCSKQGHTDPLSHLPTASIQLRVSRDGPADPTTWERGKTMGKWLHTGTNTAQPRKTHNPAMGSPALLVSGSRYHCLCRFSCWAGKGPTSSSRSSSGAKEHLEVSVERSQPSPGAELPWLLFLRGGTNSIHVLQWKERSTKKNNPSKPCSYPHLWPHHQGHRPTPVG